MCRRLDLPYRNQLPLQRASVMDARHVSLLVVASARPVRLEFVVRPPLGAGPSPGSGRPNGHCSARHRPPCVRQPRQKPSGQSSTPRTRGRVWVSPPQEGVGASSWLCGGGPLGVDPERHAAQFSEPMQHFLLPVREVCFEPSSKAVGQSEPEEASPFEVRKRSMVSKMEIVSARLKPPCRPPGTVGSASP